MNEDLRTWFRQNWVRMDTKGKIKGPCAREEGEGKPKCLPAAKARSMSKQDRATAARRKRREDPVADRKGKGNKPIMVNTEEFMMEGNEPTNPSLWSKAKSLAKQKFDVYPSAYANGWAAKWYKSKGGGWKSVSEETIDEKCWDGYKRVGMKKKGRRMVPNCVPEATDIIAKARAVAAKKSLPEDADSKKYPRKGFPEPGDYGYHSNPGLKPQESDKDEDMDVAYKKATEKEGKKPLNAKIVEAKKDLPWHEDPKNPSRKIAVRKDQYGNTIKNVAKHLAKKAMNAQQNEEVDLEESATSKNITHGYHGNVKVADDSQRPKAFAKMHAKVKKLAHAGGHLQDAKKPNVMVRHFLDSAHGRHIADDGSDKNITSRFAHFKKSYNPAMHEELGKDNEWGRPELRKKYAAATPGQESLAADKIPTFDPRYDNVTTQYSGLHPVREGYLAEISAKASMARDDFKKRLQRALTDPKNIARAKKVVAKQKAAEKAAREKEPPHLVMQLRKAVSIGSKVQFHDGKHHDISPNHANIFMSKYNAAKSSIEKESLQKRAHRSHADFMKAIAEEFHENCGTPDCCQTCETAVMGTHHVDSYEAHRGSGDQISPVISHDDEDIRFQDFDEEAFEKELEADIHALTWEDIVDLYDEDEIEYIENPEHEEEDDDEDEGEDDEEEDEDEDEDEDIKEAISPQGRLKKKFNAIRTKGRRQLARNIALKRISTPERLKSRSIRAARRMVYKRLLRNRDMSTVSAAEKSRLEAQVKRLAPMVARISVRVLPKVRKMEQSRIKNKGRRKR